MARVAESVVAFYNKRGTFEQYIKEGIGAINWTRLSCRSFAATPCVFSFMRSLIISEFPAHAGDARADQELSLTTLKEKLIKIGAKVVSHASYVAFQLAEVATPETRSLTFCG